MIMLKSQLQLKENRTKMENCKNVEGKSNKDRADCGCYKCIAILDEDIFVANLSKKYELELWKMNELFQMITRYHS